MAIDIKYTDITNSTSVTNGVSNGTGVLDKFLNTVNQHILDDFKNNRITAPDFAKIRLGSIEHSLNQATTFILQEKAIETEASLKEKQIELAAQELLIKQKELLIKDKELALMDKEIALKQAQIDVALQEVQVKLKQISVMEREIALKEQVQPYDIALKQSQKSKIDAEVVTEGKKAILVDRQTKGFTDDAYQKLLKQSLDSWSVAFSVSKDAISVPTAIGVSSIDGLFTSAKNHLIGTP